MECKRASALKGIIADLYPGNFVVNIDDFDEELAEAVRLVDDYYLSNREYSWHLEKYEEEWEEMWVARTSYQNDRNAEYRHALVGEIVDVCISISALNGFEEYDEEVRSRVSLRMTHIKEVLEEFNIEYDEFWHEVYRKCIELFIGVNTYKLCQMGDRSSKLCRVVHSLYNSIDLANKAKADKIIKEIRRMWYAINYGN